MLEKIPKNIIKNISLFLLTFLIIDYSPSMLNEIQPDSEDYQSFHETRQSTYYLIIQSLEVLGIDLILFQKLILSLSITAIFFLLKKQTNFFLCLVAYSLIIFNIYYTSFSKTILTEAFLFSFINFAVVLLFDLKKNKEIIFFSFCCGIIASLKPIGIPIALTLITIAIIKTKKLNQFFLLIGIFLIPNIIENFFFYNHFKERESVFKYSVTGKLFILSGKDSFKIEDYPENLHKLLSASKKEFQPIHQYLDSIDNIFLRSELHSDYEVVAQFQAFNFESIAKINFEKKIIFDNSSKIFFQIIKNNFSDYLMLSFYNYLGNWSISSKTRFLDINKKEIPRYNELENSSGPISIPNLNLIKLAQYFFFFLFFILTLYTLFILISFLRINKTKLMFESYSLIFIIQSYLILVSLTNVSTPRYLMPVYTLIIVIFVEFVNLFIKQKKNNFSN